MFIEFTYGLLREIFWIGCNDMYEYCAVGYYSSSGAGTCIACAARNVISMAYNVVPMFDISLVKVYIFELDIKKLVLLITFLFIRVGYYATSTGTTSCTPCSSGNINFRSYYASASL